MPTTLNHLHLSPGNMTSKSSSVLHWLSTTVKRQGSVPSSHEAREGERRFNISLEIMMDEILAIYDTLSEYKRFLWEWNGTYALMNVVPIPRMYGCGHV